MTSNTKFLSNKDVRHVSNLAKLALTDEEVEKYQKQLSEALSHIDELSEVDTSSVESTTQTTGLENVTREDIVKSDSMITQKGATSGTDNVHNNYFVVDLTLTERSI